MKNPERDDKSYDIMFVTKEKKKTINLRFRMSIGQPVEQWFFPHTSPPRLI